MKSLWRNPAHFWTVNFLLIFSLAVVHFSLYVTLKGAAFTAGGSGHTMPALFHLAVIGLGLPVMPLGVYVLAHLPQGISSPLVGQHRMSFFYILAGLNALLFGVWTTLQSRVLPAIIRFVYRAISSRLALNCI